MPVCYSVNMCSVRQFDYDCNYNVSSVNQYGNENLTLPYYISDTET